MSEQTPTPLVRRRALAAGAAWAAPTAVAAAFSPAMALSCTTQSYRLDTAGGTWSHTYSGYTSATASGTAVRTSGTRSPASIPVALSTRIVGSGTKLDTTGRGSGSFAVTHFGKYAGTFSGLNNPIPIVNSITCNNAATSCGGYDRRQITTIDFGRPVAGLVVNVGDIDSWGASGSSVDAYADQVAIRGFNGTTQVSDGGTRTDTKSEVLGVGSTTDPLRNRTNNQTSLGQGGYTWNDTAGTAGVKLSRDVTKIEVDYWSGTKGGYQVVLLTMSFNACAA